MTDLEGPILKFKDESLGKSRLALLKKDDPRIPVTRSSSLHDSSSFMHVQRDFDDLFLSHTHSFFFPALEFTSCSLHAQILLLLRGMHQFTLLIDVSMMIKHTRIQELMVRIQLQPLHLIHDGFVVPEEQAKQRL